MLTPSPLPAAPPAPPARWMPPPARCDLVAVGRRLGRRLADCDSHAALFAEAVDGLVGELDLEVAAIAVRDAGGELAWRAQHGRLTEAHADESRRLVAAASRSGEPARVLSPSGSLKLALPLRARGRLLGVLYVAQAAPNPDAALEDALMLIATQLAAMIDALRATAAAAPATATPEVAPIVVRRYAANDSLFVDDSYLIKGVAGNILWKLLTEHLRSGRRSFTNRELRVDPALRLPEIGDNLEARLILLRRRLAEHGALARIEKTGRGRFELNLQRPVRLVEVA